MTTKNTAKGKGKTTKEVAGTEAEGQETKVGPLHEAHAAYIKRTTGKDVDPEDIFLIYSTRVAFRKTSEEYQEVGARKAALKEEAEKAKAEAKAKKAAEREEAKAKKEQAKKEAAEKREAERKAKEEAKAKAKAEKEAEAAKKTPKVTKSATEDKATSKGKKGKAAF